ncbi:TadE/TadG family type IV pilus assembly protein [Microbacterium sp. SD291]|uniref:TadE/TadG family type IV pilus assembly protein n=1 Tax=Microbacterium sp. SD291 TaxID=2782007 RepID=UPI001A96D068|nr:TadE/TadG family type IV pilus assembly protein [Microbacterium sp. SD291]MBO0980869.1 pilus assembly protein [Microbacterium sp. SD291]
MNAWKRAERGATAVLVAILMVPLVGICALAVDVGALFAERAQLQNGVDAAALAVASACAKDQSDCETRKITIAQDYLDGNASIPRDATVDAVVIDSTEDTVTVTARTNVDHIFASVIVDGSSEQVGASGSAEWGSPVAGGVLPLGFGNCEFEDAVISEPGATDNRVTIELGVLDRAGCDPTDNPGGFGWLEDDNCAVHIDFETTDPDELWMLGTGGGVGAGGAGCGSINGWLQPRLNTVILIPVFDRHKNVAASAPACTAAAPDSGSKHCYHISQFAAFYLTGGKIGSFQQSDPYADANDPPAGGANGYLQGNFVKYVSVDELEFELGDGDESSGIRVVRLIITAEELADLTG